VAERSLRKYYLVAENRYSSLCSEIQISRSVSQHASPDHSSESEDQYRFDARSVGIAGAPTIGISWNVITAIKIMSSIAAIMINHHYRHYD
jgi:hypothetical protein